MHPYDAGVVAPSPILVDVRFLGDRR